MPLLHDDASSIAAVLLSNRDNSTNRLSVSLSATSCSVWYGLSLSLSLSLSFSDLFLRSHDNLRVPYKILGILGNQDLFWTDFGGILVDSGSILGDPY